MGSRVGALEYAMKVKQCFTLIALFSSLAVFAKAGAPTVRITVEVVDLDGQPIAGADVGLGGGLGTEEKIRTAKGKTDQQGSYTAEIGSIFGEVSSYARCQGYYENRAPALRLSKEPDAALKAERSGRWAPWEQTIRIVLRPVRNPVPMYAKELIAVVPVLDQPVGYDLEKGDWVAPYGRGDRTDFEFRLVASAESMTNYSATMTLRMPGEHDGIQVYDLSDANASRLFYEAPLDGYNPTWTWRNSRLTENKPHATSVIEDDAASNPRRRFIFRVRSVSDPYGRLLTAWYGKIYGPGRIELRSDRSWQIQLLYYLNPDSTRNLEFDPKRNLFRDQSLQAP